MTIQRFSLTAAAVAAALAVSVPAIAQNSDDSGWSGWPGGWGMGQMMRGYRNHMMMGDQQDWMLGHINGRLAFMKAELKITETQESAWKSFETTVKENAEVHNSMMRSMMKDRASGDFAKMALPDRIATRLTHMEARVEQLKELQKSLEQLYAVLDDDQKKVADMIAVPMMGMGRGMMGPGMGRRHMMFN